MIESRTDRDELAHPSRSRRVARRTVAVLPTLFTLGNVLCGFAAIVAASRIDDPNLPFGWTPLTFAAIFIFGGMLMDALDGRIARLTHSASELGEQLDSMADMVTFGVAPAFLAVQLVEVGTPFFAAANADDTLFGRLALVVALIYVACVALRLARFNLELNTDDEQNHDHTAFKGLPSPGAAGTVTSLVLLHEHLLARHPAPHWSLDVASFIMVGVMLLVALAMVSQIHYVHVMNRYIRGQAPFGTLVKAVVGGLLLVVMPQWSLAAGFTAYALSSPLGLAWQKIKPGDPKPIPPTGD